MAAHRPRSWAPISRTKPLRTLIRKRVNSLSRLKVQKLVLSFKARCPRLHEQPACIVTQREGDALRKAAPSQGPTMGSTYL